MKVQVELNEESIERYISNLYPEIILDYNNFIHGKYGDDYEIIYKNNERFFLDNFDMWNALIAVWYCKWNPNDEYIKIDSCNNIESDNSILCLIDFEDLAKIIIQNIDEIKKEPIFEHIDFVD
jgi:hypothetical protein